MQKRGEIFVYVLAMVLLILIGALLFVVVSHFENSPITTENSNNSKNNKYGWKIIQRDACLKELAEKKWIDLDQLAFASCSKSVFFIFIFLN